MPFSWPPGGRRPCACSEMDVTNFDPWLTTAGEPPSFGEVLGAYGSGPHADDPAVIYPDGTLTWRELDERSTRRARDLVARGVKPDDLVGLALPNLAVFHEIAFAVWKAGATPCILSPRLPEQELAEIVSVAAPRVLFAQSSHTLDGVQQIDPYAPVEDHDAVLPRAVAQWKAVTSGGSTGRPKIIVDRQPARFGTLLKGMVEQLRMSPGGVIVNPGPLSHNAAFLFTSLALLSRCRVVGLARFDAEETLRLIDRHHADWICLVPTMMHRIWSLPDAVKSRYDLSSLRAVWHVASACAPWLKRAWIDWLGADRIWELYAGTESFGAAISGEEWLNKPGSVGRVAPGSLEILDANHQPVGAGEIGEIHFPPVAASGFAYLGADMKADERGRFSLGDLGHIDEDGYLFLADRRTDLIIRGGANIYPAQVEAALDEHPAIASAVVIGLPSEEFGQTVHAILEIHPGEGLDLAGVDAFVRARLAGYKAPESYERASSPLRDDAGKVRRSALVQQRAEWLRDGRVFRESPAIPRTRPSR